LLGGDLGHGSSTPDLGMLHAYRVGRLYTCFRLTRGQGRFWLLQFLHRYAKCISDCLERVVAWIYSAVLPDTLDS